MSNEIRSRVDRMCTDVGRLHGLLTGALARRRLPSAAALLKTADTLRELSAEFECLAKGITR